ATLGQQGGPAWLEARQGQVEISPAGSSEWYTPGAEPARLHEADRLRTSSDAQARVTLADGAVLHIGPQASVMVIWPAQGLRGGPGTRLFQSTGLLTIGAALSLDSRDYLPLQPTVHIETPTTTVHVRETVGEIRVERDGTTRVRRL